VRPAGERSAVDVFGFVPATVLELGRVVALVNPDDGGGEAPAASLNRRGWFVGWVHDAGGLANGDEHVSVKLLVPLVVALRVDPARLAQIGCVQLLIAAPGAVDYCGSVERLGGLSGLLRLDVRVRFGTVGQCGAEDAHGVGDRGRAIQPRHS
jgi:hypothetical protein